MPLINSSYFDTAERNIPNTGSAEILAMLNNLIAIREREYLIKALGYELFKAFWASIATLTPEQRFLDILLGKEFTGYDGRLKRWEGLISTTSQNTDITISISEEDLFFTVDTAGGPAADDDTYVNTALADLSYRVTQRGVGPLEPLKADDSNQLIADIVINPSGGFTWRNGTKFISGDKFQLEFLHTIVDVEGYTPVTIPDSPIADYVYYWYLVNNVNHVSGTGQVEAKNENSVIVSSALQQVRAWNNMSEKTSLLHEFMSVNYLVYPEFNADQWWGYRGGFSRGELTNINEFGI